MGKIVLPAGGDVSLENQDTPDVQTLEIEGTSYNLDSEGNALKEDGSIFKTKAELEAKSTPPSEENDDEPSELEVDGVVYKINETGDAIKEDGSVFMTKQQIADAQNTTDEPADLTEVIKLVNITPVDDNGQPINYESTAEGIAQYIKDVRDITLQQAYEDLEQQFYDNNPDLYQVYLHKLNTGSIEGFGNRVDWSKVEVDKADDAIAQSIIVANEMRLGKTKEQAEYYANLIKADGKLKEIATAAQQQLVNADAEFERTALENKAILDQEAEEQATEYWNNIITTAKSGKLVIGDKTYTLPQVFKIKGEGDKIITANNDDFINYMTRPKIFVIEGQEYQLTQDQYDKYLEDSKKNYNDAVFDSLKRFVKYDTSQFIEEQVKQQTAKRIVITSKSGSKKSTSLGGTSKANIVLPVKK